MVWYKELGFSNNPFSIKPGAFSTEIVGYDLTEILRKIDEARVLFIEGEYGFGKTSILKHIIANFGGQRKIAYYNCNRAEESIDTRGILRGSKRFLARLVGGMPSDLILLLDEVERISQNDQKDILNYYKEGNIKSVVFFGPDFDKISFSIELRKLMVNNVIKLTELTEAEAVQLVRERIGNLRLVDDRIIKLVFRHSSNNPRLLLENMEDVVKYAVDNNEEQVTEDHLKEALGIEVGPAKPGKVEKPKKQAPKPKKQAHKKQPKVKSAKVKASAQKPKQEAPEEEKPKLERSKDEKPKQEKPEAKPKKARSPKSRKANPAKQPKADKPKPKKERTHHPKDRPEDEFEDKAPKKMPPGPAIDFEEETDYSEPADEDPGEDDKGGEYYYYY